MPMPNQNRLQNLESNGKLISNLGGYLSFASLLIVLTGIIGIGVAVASTAGLPAILSSGALFPVLPFVISSLFGAVVSGFGRAIRPNKDKKSGDLTPTSSGQKVINFFKGFLSNAGKTFAVLTTVTMITFSIGIGAPGTPAAGPALSFLNSLGIVNSALFNSVLSSIFTQSAVAGSVGLGTFLKLSTLTAIIAPGFFVIGNTLAKLGFPFVKLFMDKSSSAKESLQVGNNSVRRSNINNGTDAFRSEQEPLLPKQSVKADPPLPTASLRGSASSLALPVSDRSGVYSANVDSRPTK